VGHLIRLCLHKGWAGRGSRDVIAATGIVRQPVEAINEAQNICHKNIGDRENVPANHSRPASTASMRLSRGSRNVSKNFRIDVSSVSPENLKKDQGWHAASTELGSEVWATR
jgi:hypothetical protein